MVFTGGIYRYICKEDSDLNWSLIYGYLGIAFGIPINTQESS